MLICVKLSAMTMTINRLQFSIKIHKYSQTKSKYKVNDVLSTKRHNVKQNKNISKYIKLFQTR